MVLRYKFLAFGAVLAVSFLMAESALATSINPSKFQVVVGPGDGQILPLTITNDSSQPQEYRLGTTGAKQDENGRPSFSSGLYPAESWLTPDPNPVIIPAGKSKEVQFTLVAPNDAEPGSISYLGLTVEPVEKTKNALGITAKLVALLELQVAGIVNESLEVIEWQSHNKLTKQTTWPFSLKFKNTGNSSLPLEGTITIRNWRGGKVFSQPVFLGNKLLAKSTRSLTPKVDIGSLTLPPGRYRAQLRLAYGQTGQVFNATAQIWYFSESLKVALIGLIVLLTAIYMVRRRAKHKKIA